MTAAVHRARPAIVTDIDATLTTSDNEFLTQMISPGGYDPAEREGAHQLITGYAERGYFILYLTSRPDGAPMASGGSTRDATAAWLTAHGFPMDPDRTRIELAQGLVYGDSAAGYKGDALVAMEDEASASTTPTATPPATSWPTSRPRSPRP
jgi:phosphatidate phosphatase PAH1